jgi:hypothetical protein
MDLRPMLWLSENAHGMTKPTEWKRGIIAILQILSINSHGPGTFCPSETPDINGDGQRDFFDGSKLFIR